MKPPSVELAVLNSARWYEGMFTAHGLACRKDGRVWLSCETPPSFHSNLVVLSPMTTREDIEHYADEVDEQLYLFGWSLKDSYACLDLASLGFSVLFDANWIWRDSVPAKAPLLNSRLSWSRLDTRRGLAEWELAWSGDTRNDIGVRRTQQFPDSLLGSSDHAFFAGRFQGQVVAGGIANRSSGAVGVSNVFSPREFLEDAWNALVALISAAFPGLPIVGYERGSDLSVAGSAGFAPIGKLRVWSRRT